MYRAVVWDSVQVLVYGGFFLGVSVLGLSSDDTLVNIDTEHDDTTKQDTDTTEVVSKVVTVVIVNISCH